MKVGNPLGLEDACAFEAWSVSDRGTRVTLYSPGGSIRSLWFYIADEADAVHVLVTRGPEPPEQEPPVVIGRLLWPSYQRAELWLPSPLGARPIVDASEGVERLKLDSDIDYDRLLRDEFAAQESGSRRVQRAEPSPSRHWTYGTEGHNVIPFVPAPGHPAESLKVTLDQLADR